MNRSEQLILNDINELKNGKATGPDNVPANFLDARRSVSVFKNGRDNCYTAARVEVRENLSSIQ